MATKIDPGEGHPIDTIPQSKQGIPFTFYDTMWYEHELGMMTCPTCHDIHGESVTFEEERRKGLLHLTYSFGEQTGQIERGNFCVSCHKNKKEMSSGFHGQYDCKSCHLPHRDPSPPEGAVGSSWFCLKCHADVPKREAFVFEILGKGLSEKSQETGNALLFDDLGNRSKEGVISCPSCHDVHASTKRLDRTFKERSEDETCYTCHPEKREFEATRHDLSKGAGTGCKACHGICTEDLPSVKLREITRGLSANPADGDCLFCHAGQVKENFYLFHPKSKEKVKSSYGADVYVESDMQMVSRISGFGKMDFPLFAESGEEQKIGSLGCLTCHDPHRKNKIETKKNSFLRDESSSFVSSLCEPCHKVDTEKWVREYHYMRREEE